MENLKALVYGRALTTYQKGLAVQEFEKLQTDTETRRCNKCGAQKEMRWNKMDIGIDDKHGSYKTLSFNFCEECGYTNNVNLS
jgi:hypothetical protein